MQAKKFWKNLSFVGIFKATDGKSRIRIPKSSVRCTGPRIRIRTKMSRIRNTGFSILWCHLITISILFLKRRMTDSYDAAIIPLGSDTQLRDRWEIYKFYCFFFNDKYYRKRMHLEILQVHEFSWWCEDWPSSGRHGCLCSSPWYVNLF